MYLNVLDRSYQEHLQSCEDISNILIRCLPHKIILHCLSQTQYSRDACIWKEEKVKKIYSTFSFKIASQEALIGPQSVAPWAYESSCLFTKKMCLGIFSVSPLFYVLRHLQKAKLKPVALVWPTGYSYIGCTWTAFQSSGYICPTPCVNALI